MRSDINRKDTKDTKQLNRLSVLVTLCLGGECFQRDNPAHLSKVAPALRHPPKPPSHLVRFCPPHPGRWRIRAPGLSAATLLRARRHWNQTADAIFRDANSSRHPARASLSLIAHVALPYDCATHLAIRVVPRRQNGDICFATREPL